MKVIIAGSRSIDSMALVERAVAESGFQITEVVCGMARGVDSLGAAWALANGIPVKEFPADWSVGRQGGIMRNIAMADYADALIAITEGTPGTAHMIAETTRRGLKVFVLTVNYGQTIP